MQKGISRLTEDFVEQQSKVKIQRKNYTTNPQQGDVLFQVPTTQNSENLDTIKWKS